ncbi:restriction endonuclease subunit S [Shewanella sp. SG44-2]|uniref:restriction endonuclease subunit S n=1 Tax=Shewanella sp. SG44-2 TaxID=2760962 RepID=UPI0015FF57CE|nr:restriction endonuclease subunit S [Shewanella sp. SG44-2]MBB1425619.1 restriction endonuclease subunit S [Shewanella sp. SG44-2]
MSQVISDGWLNSKLEDVVDTIVGGGTPSKAISSYFQGDIPWMSVKDMNKNELVDTVDHISQEAVENSSTNVIPAGTPIVATRMSLGKIVTASFDSAINQDLKALFLNTNVEKKYFVYWYRSIANLIESLGTGTTVKGIRLEILKGLEFPLPPLAEQKVIADKLDELLAQVESTKARLDAIPALLKSFRQSVLAAAVSGKLTEEWREDNGCQITQTDIQQAFNRGWETEKLKEFELKGKPPKNDSWKNKLPQPYLPTSEEQKLFNDIPSEWEFVSVNQLTRFVKDGPHFSPKYSESGVPFISGRNITIDGVDFTSAKYISEDLHIELSKRCKPELGDILLTKGGTTGTACVNKYDFDFNVWVHVAVLRVTDENIVNPEYLSLAFNSPDVYSQSQSYTHGVANRDLGLKRMIKICFPIPHIKEQTEIVRRVEDLFAFADKVEAQVNAAQTRVNNLTQSILAKAFRGELTADWRVENPELICGENSALALLERIKSEREALALAAKAAKKKPAKKTNSRKKA